MMTTDGATDARQVFLSSIRYRLGEVRQLMRHSPLTAGEEELLGNLVTCLDVAVEDCLSDRGGTQ